MLSPITAETYQNLQFDAGVLLYNFDYSTATDAKTLADLVKSDAVQKSSWLGATKGGVNIPTNRQTWNPEFDYAGRNLFKGGTRFAGASPKMTGTLVEMRPKNMEIVSGAAKTTTAGKITTVQPLADIPKDAYLDNVVWIGCVGEEGYCLVELKNAVCVSGINFQSADKNIGALPFEFAGHQDSPVPTEELPVKYLFFAA